MLAVVCVMLGSLVCADASYLPVAGTASPTPGFVSTKPDPAAVKTLGIEITSVSFDNPTPSRLAAMTKICAETGCVYYRKTCSGPYDGGWSVCDYAVGNPAPSAGYSHDVMLPGQFAIRYASPDAFKIAEQKTYLAVGPGNNRSYVPLALLREATNTFENSYCGKDPEPGC